MSRWNSELKYVIGDATDPVGEGSKIIVHCCNDQGGWGAGFVVALSKKWQEPENAYRAMPNYVLGDVDFVRIYSAGAPILYVANLIGQHGIGMDENGAPPIRYDALVTGLTTVGDTARTSGASVHMPRMGAGLAGGDWNIIEAIVESCIVKPGADVTVYDLMPVIGVVYENSVYEEDNDGLMSDEALRMAEENR